MCNKVPSIPSYPNGTVTHILYSFLFPPGTSGAKYIDYIVGDMHVTPPEHMNVYSEKFAIMSRSYQANYYKRHLNNLLQQKYNYNEENTKSLTYFQEYLQSIHRGSKQWKDLRINEGLPSSSNIFVFANFNKQDKLEPNIFSIWMQIMIRVPNSILWLLEPVYLYSKDDIENKIFDMAESMGVQRHRIIFAKRVDKAQHLQRGIVADLFLDRYLIFMSSVIFNVISSALLFNLLFFLFEKYILWSPLNSNW